MLAFSVSLAAGATWASSEPNNSSNKHKKEDENATSPQKSTRVANKKSLLVRIPLIAVYAPQRTEYRPVF